MSEKIKITVVVHDEKTKIRKTAETGKNVILTQNASMTLMSILLEKRLMDGSFCGQRGECGRCVVQFLEGAPLPTGADRARLTPEKLRQGYRLACMARPKTDCVVKIVRVEETEPAIVTEMRLPSGNIDLAGQKKYLSKNQTAGAMKSDAAQTTESENAVKKTSAISNTEAGVMKFSEEQKKKGSEKNAGYIIAVDLGTTTIAMQLRDVETGETADTYCERNPQRTYGSDVLSRIQASVAGGGEELRRLVCEALLRGLGQFMEYLREKNTLHGPADLASGLKNIACICIAGNTTMEHLLLGYDVGTLGRAPFVPVETGLQEISLSALFSGMWGFSGEAVDVLGQKAEFPVYIAPCISAFVGGDIVAGLYALRMISVPAGQNKGCAEADMAETVIFPTPVGQNRDLCGVVESAPGKGEQTGVSSGTGKKAVLLIDLGTNGEMAVTDGNRMIVTAAAAGSAFEGDGLLMGTDRIALTAKLLREGILDETGLLKEPYFTEGVCIGQGKEGTSEEKNSRYFKQEDIRALQMAKAAVRAGVEILWEEMGRPEIGRIYLAGGFGYYLDVEAAFAIGLLPSGMRGRVLAAGNTSLAGAYELGRDLYQGRLEAGKLEERLSSIISINLARRESFERLYLKYMNLEEN